MGDRWPGIGLNDLNVLSDMDRTVFVPFGWNGNIAF